MFGLATFAISSWSSERKARAKLVARVARGDVRFTRSADEDESTGR
jgi:hypothetical protein